MNSIYCDEIRRCLKYELKPAKNRGFYICPVCGSGNHGNKTGALKVYNGVKWFCFSCKKGGDIFDLIMLKDNLTPEETRKEVRDRYEWVLQK